MVTKKQAQQALNEEFKNKPFNLENVSVETEIKGLGKIVTTQGGLIGLRDMYKLGAEPITARDYAYTMIHHPIYSPVIQQGPIEFKEGFFLYEYEGYNGFLFVRDITKLIDLKSGSLTLNESAVEKLISKARQQVSLPIEERTNLIYNVIPNRESHYEIKAVTPLTGIIRNPISRWLFGDLAIPLLEKSYSEAMRWNISPDAKLEINFNSFRFDSSRIWNIDLSIGKEGSLKIGEDICNNSLNFNTGLISETKPKREK